MTLVHHLNCGFLQAPPNPRVGCHCLLLEDPRGLGLVDTGIGLQDVRQPLQRIGQPLIDLAGFQFNEADTAVRQIERLGYRPSDVTHVALTHGDPGSRWRLGGLSCRHVHVAEEELANIRRVLLALGDVAVVHDGRAGRLRKPRTQLCEHKL
ncbi:MAG TPA: MBL fold metallo-hydrolase [Candidatus Limnocylindria bacterium]|nr:MBL fold metallo-hydrolase [Candidatus Limnocylindria bacterium]